MERVGFVVEAGFKVVTKLAVVEVAVSGTTYTVPPNVNV